MQWEKVDLNLSDHTFMPSTRNGQVCDLLPTSSAKISSKFFLTAILDSSCSQK